MENYAFFSSFWFTWSPVSKLVWILLLNSINKAFLLNISAAFELFCCDDSRLKGEKWSMHVGGGLLLKMAPSDCVKMCPVCNIALSYFCCLPSELTFSTRGSETDRWLKRLCIVWDLRLSNRMGKARSSLDDPTEEKEGKVLRLKEQE